MDKSDKANYPILKMTMTLEKRPAFYRGEMPLVYKSVMKSLMDVSLPMGHYIINMGFGDFQTEFSYTDGWEHAGVACTARTTDLSGRLLAEAGMLQHRTGSYGLEAVDIEEIHYDDAGRVAFKCTSEINREGVKCKERVISGTKTRDYYFLWPVNLYPEDDIGLEDSPLLPSTREDFFHTTVFHVTQPQRLPSSYSWLKPQYFGLYRGNIKYPRDRVTRADWAWEIVYVNGQTKDGAPSSLGYSLFLSVESEWFGKVLNVPLAPSFPPLPGAVRSDRGIEWFTPGLPDPGRRQHMPMGLSFPVLFPCVSEPPKGATMMVETPLGKIPCFSLERHGLGFMRGTAYYEASRCILIGMDIGDGKESTCSFRLSETNIPWR